MDAHPVVLAIGHKVESDTDVTVRLPGRDFRIVREYSSEIDHAAPGLVGPNWSLSVFRTLIPGEGSDPPLYMTAPPMAFSHVFEPVDAPGATRWEIEGASTQYVVQETLTVDSTTYDVWRLVAPGSWEMDFYRAGGSHASNTPDELEGLLLQQRDWYGNAHTYKYDIYGSGQDAAARLSSIYLDGESEADAAAEVAFGWNLTGDTSEIHGMLSYIRVLRDPAWEPVETQYVRYIYKEDVEDASADLGSDADLVQVIRAVRADLPVDVPHFGEEPYWLRITQYRYHDGSSGESADERLETAGAAHQLKMVIGPTQIEHYAQKRNWDFQFAEPDFALTAAAAELLTMSDDDEPPAWPSSPTPKVVDIASKVIGYYMDGADEGRVQRQYVQGGCGCAGAAQGVRRQYSYMNMGGSQNPSAKVEEHVYDTISSGYDVLHRTTYHDSVRLANDTMPLLQTRAVVEPVPGSRRWVWHREYDNDGRLVRRMMPSAITSYTAADEQGGPSVTVSTSSGLVYGYEYTDDSRLSGSYVREGNDASLSNFTLVRAVNYPTGSLGADERKWLPTSVERFADESDQSAEKVEKTTFSYKFYAGTDRLKWIERAVEAETESENGPAGTGVVYESHRLFSERGLNEWSRAADNTLTRREYAPDTGALVRLTRNADVGDLDPQDYGLTQGDISGWGNSGDRLATEYFHDLLGRVVERVGPGGVRHYTIREMREDDQRPGLFYYARVGLPHKLDGTPATFDGPARITFYNAGNSATRISEFSIDGAEAYDPENLEYTLVGELSRSTVVHNLAGLAEAGREWHDVNGAWHTSEQDRFYETTYAYDGLGRREFTTLPTGTVHHNAEYDVLDRLLEVRVGTSEQNTETVARYFYDHTLDGQQEPQQGLGDGRLTFIRLFTGEDGTLADEERDTVRSFDYRGRLFRVQNPEPPHEFIVYDNLDRVVERGVFADVPTGIANPLADRGLYTRNFYSQRGLLYRQEIATDPTDQSPDFLESNFWFDEVGRTVAQWQPNAPGVKREYDALGRVTATYVTDRGGDASPGTSGNYADATALTGDTVLEQVEYQYNEDLLELVTSRQRLHDASGTGALGSSDAVATYAGYVYDGADRRVATIDWGTNTTGFKSGGSAPTVPASVPSPTDQSYEDTLISTLAYNERGFVDTATVYVDTSGTVRVTRYFYDDLGRTIAVAENFDDASIDWTGTLSAGRWTVSGLDGAEPDTDRVTSYVYNGVGNVVRQIAHVPDGTQEAVQVTEYVYGVAKGSVGTTTDSLVHHADLLAEVRYPDRSTGQPGAGNEYKVRYAYNRLGELRSIVDQNQSRHEYARDPRGRVTADAVAALGTGIDGAVRRIQVGFDDLGRMADAESYDAASAGDVVNAVRFTYTPLWQVEKIYQSHDGPVQLTGGSPTGNTVELVYEYDTEPVGSTSAGNFSRLKEMTLPYGTTVSYTYGGVNDRVGRVSAAGYSRGVDVDFLQYSYIGLGGIAEVDYPEIDIQLDYTLTHEGQRRTQSYTTGTSGEYPGYDRFGRIVRQVWADGDLTEHGSLTTVPNKPPILEELYTYDRASNRLARIDGRPGASRPDRDFQYDYDGLDRLVEARRGVSGGSFTHGVGSQKWALDMLGNWREFATDEDGNGQYASAETEERSHNMANEITSLDPAGTGPPPSIPFAYDDNGNIKSRGDKKYVHDGWNRMVRVYWDDVWGPEIVVGEDEHNPRRTLKGGNTGGSAVGVGAWRSAGPGAMGGRCEVGLPIAVRHGHAGVAVAPRGEASVVSGGWGV